jgi:hypothetical protein
MTMAAKLSRVLHGFLEGDVLPQAERAADLGLDPTPLLAVVSEFLRLYADALRLPNHDRSLTVGLGNIHPNRVKTPS